MSWQVLPQMTKHSRTLRTHNVRCYDWWDTADAWKHLPSAVTIRYEAIVCVCACWFFLWCFCVCIHNVRCYVWWAQRVEALAISGDNKV